MFFHINEEMLRKVAEQLNEAAGHKTDAAEEGGPRMILGSDGVPILDDPTLVTVISVKDGSPPQEDIDRTKILSSIGWVPLRFHPLWRDSQ